MTASASTEPMKRRSGWRMLGLIVVGMVLLAIGGGFWWYYDDSDLNAIRAEARARGRSATWAEMKLVTAPQERVHIWQRLVALTKQVKSFRHTAKPPNIVKLPLFEPIPDELRNHHASLDPTALTEFVLLIDQLGDSPLVMHDSMNMGTLLPEIGETREFIRFLSERVMLADPATVSVECRRMLTICNCFSADSLMQHLVRSSVVQIALETITLRLNDLKQNDPGISDVIVASVRDPQTRLMHAMEGEFLTLMETLESGDRRQWLEGKSDDWLMPLVVRTGRSGMLLAHLDALDRLDGQDVLASIAWAQTVEADFSAAKSGFPYPSLIMQGFLMPVWSVAIAMSHQNTLRGHLLAAELRDSPWPVDTFNPTGAQLRPIIREGRMIAAYSVHTDGIDQGGDEKLDRIFPLYAKP